jgi:ElaB/YqjD/DUF883 family membrane-anchored ribosome-binding protein
MRELTAMQREKLVSDMRAVMSDAEELLSLGAGDVSESARGLKERLRSNLGRAKDSLVDMQAVAGEKVKAAGYAADEYVHENPWRSVAVGAGVGLVVGLLIGRR